MKLKTLKDIIENCEPLGDVVNPAVLKAEAVKWKKDCSGNETDVNKICESCKFIMHFFNLTEEDLR